MRAPASTAVGVSERGYISNGYISTSAALAVAASAHAEPQPPAPAEVSEFIPEDPDATKATPVPALPPRAVASAGVQPKRKMSLQLAPGQTMIVSLPPPPPPRLQSADTENDAARVDGTDSSRVEPLPKEDTGIESKGGVPVALGGELP
jgi:hypothetical protein